MQPLDHLHPKAREGVTHAAGIFHSAPSLESTKPMFVTIFLLSKKNIQMLLLLLPWQATLNRWYLPCTWHLQHQSRLNFISTELKRWILFICPPTRTFLRTSLFNSFRTLAIPYMTFTLQSVFHYTYSCSKRHSPQEHRGPKDSKFQENCVNSQHIDISKTVEIW